MELYIQVKRSDMNEQKLKVAISEFVNKKKSNAAYYEENWTERKERKEYYQSFTKGRLLAMTEEEFLEYISKLWSMLIWGNKKYVVDKMMPTTVLAHSKSSWPNYFMAQALLKSVGMYF